MRISHNLLFALTSVVLFGNVNAQTMIVNEKLTCDTWPKIKSEVPVRLYIQGLMNGMSLVYWAEREAKVGIPTIDPLSELRSRNEAFSMIDAKCANDPTSTLDVAALRVFYDLHTLQTIRKSRSSEKAPSDASSKPNL